MACVPAQITVNPTGASVSSSLCRVPAAKGERQVLFTPTTSIRKLVGVIAQSLPFSAFAIGLLPAPAAPFQF